MISTSDFRTGLTIEFEGGIYTIVDFQHVKPGKGAAFVRTKLKNIETGAVTERTFNPRDKFEQAHIDRRPTQYLYESDGMWNFMDSEDFNQYALTADELGDAVKYLKENMELHLQFYKGKVIGVDLPVIVELEVVETEPGIKGDTASGGSKTAVMDTGLVVQVPLFINVGDVLRIDTRTGNYSERVKE
ncbi:MAG: elongation factor P [Bacillota bacterium]|jgi:elongation factor P|nr:elongation factor P [Bacillota bacterium]HOC05730.1 elongation factor P [Bacillota bacterium]HPZ21427.1 elongation factor P [Bacillota bacterium]HQD19288.1 elongation factor P [Bacillota bacterium]